MIENLVLNAYLYLFVLSFLAATVIPLGSEWLLVTLLTRAHDPAGLVLTATAGNVLGAMTTYWIGMYGGPWLIGSVLRLSDESLERAGRLYRTYGSWSLLLSWLPIVGDPLCLVAGVFRLRFIRFTVLVLSGKLARYSLVALITLGFL